jgi:hypothetical protein
MKKPCKLCGNLIEDDDWDLCESCRKKNETFENATDIGNSYREEVSINGFFKHCFSQQDIDDILYAKFKSLTDEEQKRLIESYCEDDMLYFVDWLVRKCKK